MRVLSSRGKLLGIFGIHYWVCFKCRKTVKSPPKKKEDPTTSSLRGSYNLNCSDGSALRRRAVSQAKGIVFLFLCRGDETLSRLVKIPHRTLIRSYLNHGLPHAGP
jgi:hypothetical protein